MKDKSFERAARINAIHPKWSDRETDGNIPCQRHSVEQPGLFAGITADRTGIQGHSTLLNRVAGRNPAGAADIIRTLQKGHGNRYVQRMLAINTKGNGSGEVSREIENAIQGAKGTGHALDSAARSGMEPAFGADFSDVRVHTGPQADTLGRSLNARAFTTGRDIFFRDGEYNPGSSGGRELLAHELTHVVQQGGGVQGKFNVSSPDNEQEQEADQVAREIAREMPQTTAADEDALVGTLYHRN